MQAIHKRVIALTECPFLAVAFLAISRIDTVKQGITRDE